MRKQKKNFFSRSSVRIIAMAVFLCTVYLLKLPAISTSKAGVKLTCSRQEHTHISECYVTAADLSEHICDPLKEAENLLENLGIAGISPVSGVSGQFEMSESAVISAEDKEKTGNISDAAEAETDDRDSSDPVYSVMPDDDPIPEALLYLDKVYILHTHNEYCYGDEDSDGNSGLSDLASGHLLCELEEICAHVHDSECYECMSSEDGFEEKRLCCKDLAIESHMHEEDCLDESGKYLLCSSPLVVEHEHTLSCFDEIEEQVCILEEYSHTDSCYESISKEVPGIGTVLNPDGSVRAESAGSESAGSAGPDSDASADADSAAGDAGFGAGSGSDSSASSGSSGTGTDAGIDADYTGTDSVDPAIVIDKNVYESVVMQDLGPFVTSVKASVNGDVLDDGSDISNIVASYSKVDFQIEYKLPPNQLAGNAVNFRYELPDNFVIRSGGIHGDVYKASGEKVGIFSVVTDDKGNNYAYITFTDEKFIAGNISTDSSAGSEISGYLNFSLQGSDLESDDTGDTDLKFTTAAGDVTIHIHVPGKEIVSKEDLSVNKTASEPDADGVITYTITISSQNGTAGPVKVADWIHNAILYGENGDGNFDFGLMSPVPNIIRNENSNSYELTLPAMSPGDVYTFTYEVKADTNANTTVYVSNTVNVSSIRSDGALLKDTASTTTVLHTSLIWKAAGVRWDGSQLIDWTIQINEAGIDIGGYTLSDPMFSEAIGGLVKISPDPNSSDPDSYTYIKFDENNSYTFPEGSAGTYTVTFTTKWGDISLGDHGIVNTAELSKGDSSYTGSATAWVSPYHKDALIKSAVGNAGSADAKQPVDYSYVDEDGNTVHAKVIDLKWSVKIDAISGTLQPDWYYIDQLDNPENYEYQWFTWEQIKGVKNSLDNALKTAGLDLAYDFILCPVGEPNVDVNYNTACSSSGNLEFYRAKRYKGFKLIFHDELPKGKSFEFEYSSKARIDTLTDIYSFINTGTLKDSTGSITDTASQPYVPTLSDFVISKVDQRNPNGGDQTEVNYQAVYDSTLDAYVLKWKLNILIPASYDGESITIILR